MRRTLSIWLLLALSTVAFAAKSSYKITFMAEGNTDSVLYMGYYLAQYRLICDTAVNNGKGKFVFEGDEALDPGLYYITNQKDHFAEFIVYREKQRFTLSTDNVNWKLGMTAKNSRENELYFNFNRANEVFFQEYETAKKTMDSVEFNTVFVPAQRLKIDSVMLDFIQRYPECMISRMMMATKDVDVPKEHADGSQMTNSERRSWFLSHFLDNMPVDDDFILRTHKSVFYDRVMEYVDRVLAHEQPSVICPLLDSLIDRAEPAPQVYRWLILNLTQHYLQSRVMVYDEVYVHLVQRYFAAGKVMGLSPSVIDEQIERANKWERLLVGRVSPELILFDTVHHAHSLHHMPGRYTLLLFWSPTCGHCRDIIPAVYKVYEKYADSLNVSAFAILTEPDDQTVVKWKKFLADHQMTDSRWVNLNGGEANVDWREVYDITTTPQIFLIDNRDHKFVAKKLGADILESVFKALMNEKENE